MGDGICSAFLYLGMLMAYYISAAGLGSLYAYGLIGIALLLVLEVVDDVEEKTNVELAEYINDAPLKKVE